MSKFIKERYQEIQSQLKELIDNGMSCSEICKHLGIRACYCLFGQKI